MLLSRCRLHARLAVARSLLIRQQSSSTSFQSSASSSSSSSSRIPPQPHDIDAVERAAHYRRAVRSFDVHRSIPDGVLERCLAIAQRAPSGWNLQPWVAVIVTEPLRKTALCEAVLGQKKVKEAPATIVFAGNKHVKQNLEDVSRASVEAGVWSPEYARRVDMQVRLMLSDCPLVQSAKHTLLELVRPFAVVPSVPQTLEGYVWKQTALAAQQFMLAAAAHGLDTAPMEGLDEARVRQVVGLPRHFTIPLVVSVGYAKDEGAKSVRLDPQRVFFHETTS